MIEPALAVALGFVAHLVGDYLLQSDWMSSQKTSKMWPAVAHGITYTLPFLLITQSIPALLVIGISHIIIDRYRLAKYVIWLKNQMAPRAFRSKNPWTNPDSLDNPATGYSKSKPDWMSVWLMIIGDNSIHLVINTLAILFL